MITRTQAHEFSKISTAQVDAACIRITSPSGLNFQPGIGVLVNGNLRLPMTTQNARQLVRALLAAMAEQQQQEEEQ